MASSVAVIPTVVKRIRPAMVGSSGLPPDLPSPLEPLLVFRHDHTLTIRLSQVDRINCCCSTNLARHHLRKYRTSSSEPDAELAVDDHNEGAPPHFNRFTLKNGMNSMGRGSAARCPQPHQQDSLMPCWHKTVVLEKFRSCVMKNRPAA